MTNRPVGKWRLHVVFSLLMLAMAALGGRMVQLVRAGRQDAGRMVLRQQLMVIPEPGRQGNIFVRTGKGYVLLAGTRCVPSCFADPNLIDDEDIAPTAIELGRALGMDPVQVQEKIHLRRQRRFVWVKRSISPAEANAVRALELPWVGITYEWKREYPNGGLAASVVGFPPAEDTAGTGAGVELAMHEVLSARDGRRVMLTDAARRPIVPVPERSTLPADGRSVLLCIDASIQGYLEQAVAGALSEFAGRWATGVVVEPHTGRILAMCSLPSFNPNQYADATPADRTNRAVTVPYEPGSVAKPIFAAAAVEAGVVNYDTKIFCENGTYRAPRGGRISDHGSRYGWLSVRDVVVHSSNIGMAKIGEKLGNEQIHGAALRFGLGSQTNIDLPGESRGILRDLRRWDGYSMRRVPFGQEISTTTIQLAMAFCALANGGELLRPRVVDRVIDADGRTVWTGRRTMVRRAVSPRVAAETLAVMAEVVERGTGKACKLTRWTSFGKTGTAQVPGPGGYEQDAYTSSFVGGAPAEAPRVLCLVSVFRPNKSKGYYGAKVAAPAVRQVLEQTLSYLDVPPDRHSIADSGLRPQDVPLGRISD
ncbi:MAG TPA: penicillin-binding protein 2 [Phycisphaerae bacterium]|nr:penicillin-binding protein 2 [Phycisphaerae bacterium]